MKPVPCPKCGARIALEDAAQGERVRCPLCGHLFEAPIEVRAEVQGGDDDETQPPPEAEAEGEAEGTELTGSFEEAARRIDRETVRILGGRGMEGRVITIHRHVQGNPGCCLGGCALLVFAAIVFLMGLQSLFRALFGA